MISTLIKYIFIAVIIFLSTISCTKENQNNRLMAGAWKAKQASVKKFIDNKMVLDSAIDFKGTMQLQNKSSADNAAFFVDFTGNVFSPGNTCNWQVSSKKLNSINFFLIDPTSLTQFSVVFNVEKASRTKLVLTRYITDATLNLQQKTSYEFEKF